MTPVEDRFVHFWEKSRRRGKWHYSFRHGVVMFAWPVFILTEILKYATSQKNWEISYSRVLTGICIYSILGFFAFGWLMWNTQEKRYQKLLTRLNEKNKEVV
jgi:thiol:disulfide interchange protein